MLIKTYVGVQYWLEVPYLLSCAQGTIYNCQWYSVLTISKWNVSLFFLPLPFSNLPMPPQESGVTSLILKCTQASQDVSSSCTDHTLGGTSTPMVGNFQYPHLSNVTFGQTPFPSFPPWSPFYTHGSAGLFCSSAVTWSSGQPWIDQLVSVLQAKSSVYQHFPVMQLTVGCCDEVSCHHGPDTGWQILCCNLIIWVLGPWN